MAASRRKRMKYIRDIPTPIRQQICDMFDDVIALKNWKHLAGLLEFSNDRIATLQLCALRPGGSPTDTMLTEWDHRNHTIEELFRKLHELEHVRSMELLKDLVDPSLHGLMNDPNISGPVDYGGYNHGNTGPHPANIPPALGQENRFGSQYSHQHQPLMQQVYHPSSNPQQNAGGPHQQLQPQNIHCQQHPDHSNSNNCGTPATVGYQSANPGVPPLDHRKMASVRLDNTTSNNMAPQHPYSQQYGPNNSRQYGAMQMGPPQRYQSQCSARDDMAPPVDAVQIDSLSSSKIPMYQPGLGSNASSECSVDQCLSTTIDKPFSMLAEATDNFSDQKKLGEGAFGKVYYGQLNMTEVAIKKIIKNDNVMFDHSKIRRDQIKEIRALTKYRHENIVPLLAYSIDGDNLYLIFSFMKNGSLEKKLELKHTPLDWRMRHRILEGAARGIHYLHTAIEDNPLIHQDIKSANILLDEHFVAKIGDFGLARPGPSRGKDYTAIKTSVVFGTRAYLAPEFTREHKLSTRLDVYSFGVVLMEVVTGEKAGSAKQRLKYDNLLTRNVDRIMDDNEGNPEKAVGLLRDPRCPDWPTHHAYDLLKQSIKCIEDFRQRPQMEAVLKNLLDINKRMEKERCSSSRNVQPTENTEPMDSRPGEESSYPSSMNGDQEAERCRENGDALKCGWGTPPGVPEAHPQNPAYAGLHVLANGPAMRNLPQPLINPGLREPPGGNFHPNYCLPVSTCASNSGYKNLVHPAPDSTTHSTDYSSSESPYNPQYNQPQMPYQNRQEMVGRVFYGRSHGEGGYMPCVVPHDDGMPYRLPNGHNQPQPRVNIAFDSYPRYPGPQPRFHAQEDLTHRGVRGEPPNNHHPPHPHPQVMNHGGRSDSPSSSSSSDQLPPSSPFTYPRMPTLNLSDLSIESSDSSQLTGESSAPTPSQSSSSSAGHGGGCRATGSDSVTSTTPDGIGEGGHKQVEAESSAVRMGREGDGKVGPEEGVGRIPTQDTEPQA